MPNKKISQLVNKTIILSTDLFPIGDATSGQLYKKTIAELQAAIGGAVISVNGLVGTVVLDTDDIQELVSPTNKWFTDARARGAVSATSPLAYNSSTGVFSIPAATTSANGYLTSTDWNTFNGKENVLTFSSPLVRTSNTISMPAATTSVSGYLTSTDWNTFNNKQGALTLTTTGSSGSATLASNTLNIPTYTLAGLGGITAYFLSGGTGITYNSGTGVIATTITQYTDALARASLSFTAGSGAYNSTTGVITIPTNTSQLTNGANFITLASLSGGTGISYNSTTGAISYSGTVYTDSSIRGLFSGSTGISYNSTTGAISSTITQYTDALARAAISLTTTGSSGASTYNSTTGVINVPTYTLSGLGGQPALSGTGFVKISGTTISYDNSTYLTTASAASTYQTIITNPVTGTGTTNYLSKWTSSSALGNSLIYDNGTNVIIGGTTVPDSGLKIYVTNGTVGLGNYLSSTVGYIGTWTNHTLGFAINGTNKMTLDTSGNLGLGVTPSAWASGFKAMQMTGGVAIASHPSLPIMYLGANYLASDTGAKYIQSDGAARLLVNGYSGGFQWDIAPSGTAGTSISFTQAMTLASSGNLLVGTTTDSGYKLDINGTGRFSGDLRTTTGNVSVYNSNVQVQFIDTANSNYQYSLQNYSSQFRLYNNSTSTTVLNFASTGAATFSSNVTANEYINVKKDGSDTAFSGSYLSVSNAANNVSWGWQLGASNKLSLWLYNGGPTINPLNIASTGAATFSSSVQATSIIRTISSGGGLIWTELQSDGIYSTNTDLYLYAPSSKFMSFYAGGTERMLITSGGLVGIGTSSPNNYGSTSLTIASSSGVNNGALIVRNSTDGLRGHIYSDGANGLITIGSATNHAVSFVSYDTERGRITNGGNWLLGTSTDNGEKLYISGNVRATGTITANSDIRLKKNLERIENALEKVGQISGYTYDTIYDDKRHGGVIAQEIDEVFPEIVNKGNDGLLGVEYGNISALLIEALKELKEKNTALEARLQALEK